MAARFCCWVFGTATPWPKWYPARALPPDGRLPLILIQIQRHRVDAVAQAGRLRAIVKDMPQVSIAAAAFHLGSQHAVTPIGFFFHRLTLRGRIEARPSAARIELRLGAKQLRAAADTFVGAGRFHVLVFAAKR